MPSSRGLWHNIRVPGAAGAVGPGAARQGGPSCASVRLFLVLLCLGVLGAGAAAGEGTPQEEAQRLNQQAVELYQAGQYQKALPLVQRALEINEKALGPEHPDLAVSLNNLAGLYQAMGAYDKALPLYQRALTIREKALGPEAPRHRRQPQQSGRRSIGP